MDSPHSLSNTVLFLVILINFSVLGTSRLGACIKLTAAQGALLGLLPILLHGPSAHALILTAGAVLFKGFLIPRLLFHATKEVRIRRELEPRIGYIGTLLLGALAAGAGFFFGATTPLLPEHQHCLVVPASLTTLIAGFLLMVTRRKAITQVVGYLIFENGIFIFGALLSDALPLMVEAGVFLDMLVAVFVMGIVVNHINREFSSINTEKLALLRD